MLGTLRNCIRLSRVALILAAHDVLFFWRDEASPEKGRKLARALERMGPTFIKLGQALSTRSDLVGESVAMALADLRDRLPPFSSVTARAIIEEQLGKPVAQLFTHFEDTPAAAASIAQVHYAITPEGKEVAVKILRPGIEKAFARDIALFYWLADRATRWRPEWKRLHLTEVVAMFEDMIRFELDLRFEAASAVKLRENLAHDEGILIPEVYWTSTARHVLTLERIHGVPISDIAALRAAGHDLTRLVNIAAVSLFNQVFRDGFFHGDLHPGNLFVMPNGTLAIVDFGIMGRLDRRTRIYLAQILHGFLTEDYDNLSRVHFEAGLVPPHKSQENFALALMAITKPIIGRNMNEISVARLLGQLFTTAETFEMEVQPHLLLLQKNMMIAEGVGRMLNPQVNMWQVAQPLIERWATEHMGAKARIKEAAEDVRSLFKMLPEFLENSQTLLAQINKGGIEIDPECVAPVIEQRRRFHTQWLWFSWIALLTLVLVYITHSVSM